MKSVFITIFIFKISEICGNFRMAHAGSRYIGRPSFFGPPEAPRFIRGVDALLKLNTAAGHRQLESLIPRDTLRIGWHGLCFGH